MKYIAIALACFAYLFLYPWFTVVFANEVEYKSTTRITVEDNNSLYIQQDYELQNTSSQNLVNSFSINLPSNPSSIVAEKDGMKIPVNISRSQINIDISSSPIRLNSIGKIKVSYRVDGFVSSQRYYSEINWPGFKLDGKENQHITTIFVNKNKGDLLYRQADESQVSITNERYEISLPSSKGAYLVFGNIPITFDINAKWMINNVGQSDANYRIPLPSESLGLFQYKSLTGADYGYLDDYGNKYVALRLNQDELREGTIVGQWVPYTGFTFPEDLSLGKYQANVQSLAIDLSAERSQIRKALLDLLNPSFEYGLSKRSGIIESLTFGKQSPIDYANIFQAAYHSAGIPTKIVVGIRTFPGEQNYKWHAWLLVKTEDGWISEDPYLDDLHGFSQTVPFVPHALPWIIINQDDELKDIAFYSIDPASVITSQTSSFDNQDQEMDISGELFLKDAAYSAVALPLYLRVTNLGSVPVSIKEIEIMGTKIDEHLYKYEWLIPGSTREIPITGVSVDDPFYSGKKLLEGYVEFTDGNNTSISDLSLDIDLEIDYQRLAFNTLLLLIIVVIIAIIARRKFSTHKKRSR